MIKFGFMNYETEYPEWSKHHKQIGIHVKRVYEDGKIIEAKYESLRKIVNENEERLKSKRVELRDKDTLELIGAIDYFLPLDNLSYEDGNVQNYSIGCMNTKQTTYVRLNFMIEDCAVVLEDSFTSSGSYASSFYDSYISSGSIEDTIEEILDRGLELKDVGIQRGNEDDYLVVALDEALSPIDFEVSKNDLLKSLIGIEVYKFEQEITN